MIHTIEFSRQLSKEQFYAIKSTISDLKPIYKDSLWVSYSYYDKGISKVSLLKVRQRKSMPTPYYMIAFTVNPGRMFNGDSYLSTDITSFSEIFIRTIYYHIYELFPLLELLPKYRFSSVPAEAEVWYENNTFNTRRIDFTFDIFTYNDIYINLLDKGYSYKTKTIQRSYYSSESDNTVENDDIDDSILDTIDIPDEKYIYYKGKSFNINIYNKEYALSKMDLPHDNTNNYDFLRFECQLKKGSLNYIVKKFNLPNRDIRYLAASEIEAYVLKQKINVLTGPGYYCSLKHAYSVIDSSTFKPSKKNKLKAFLDIINKTGIAGTLTKIESGDITDIGTLRTAKEYLREIHSLGFNPLTLPTNVEIPSSLINTGISTQTGAIIPGLTDWINRYAEDMIYIKENGYSSDQVGL